MLAHLKMILRDILEYWILKVSHRRARRTLPEIMSKEAKASMTLVFLMGAFLICWLPFFIWMPLVTVMVSRLFLSVVLRLESDLFCNVVLWFWKWISGTLKSNCSSNDVLQFWKWISGTLSSSEAANSKAALLLHSLDWMYDHFLLNFSSFSKSNKIAFCNCCYLPHSWQINFGEKGKVHLQLQKIPLFHKDFRWFFLRRQLCGQPSNICASSLRIQTGYSSAWRFPTKKDLFNFRCSLSTGMQSSPFSASVTEGNSPFRPAPHQSYFNRISERRRQLNQSPKGWGW